ncbi:MAG: CHAD domain-containing protein [Chloracidobacterium sp.]|nr:CHAD domain-containing protein [Chloracidobacterium sp.]
MAKAKLAPAVTSTADLYEWAAGVLGLRFDEVMSYSNAVLVPWNVNAVHDMRVALRRLRSALRDFVQVIDEKPLKRVKVDLKKISDLLGVVRDQDVAIIALEELAAAARDDSIKTGISELISGFKNGREQSHARLQKALGSIPLDELHQRFSNCIEDSLRQQELFSPGSLRDAGCCVIKSRLREFRDKGTEIYDPFDSVQIHDLRIAAKRLRYSIELFGVCWGDEITEFASGLARMQSFLGDVHDCDVWTAILTKRLKDEDRTRARDKSAAAAWLLSKFVGKRSKAYRSALDLWSEWEASGFADRLHILME